MLVVTGMALGTGKEVEMETTLQPVAGSPLTKAFHPGKVWLDDRGKPIESHLGGLYYEDGVYYWYGMNFDGETAKPFTFPNQGYAWMINQGTTCYSSRDLYRWKLESSSLLPVKDDPAHPLSPPNWVIRPKVLKCAKTGRYVMMAQLVSPDFSTLNKVVVGVADQPQGPFAYWKVLDPPGGGYDITLYQDDDDRAYLICTHEWVKAHLLSDDYLFIEKTYELNGVTGEAPAVFKHDGIYYFLTSHLTGWEPNPNKYAVAAAFLGPYETKGTFCTGPEAANSFGGQTTFVLPVAGKPGAFIWMADRVNAKSQTEIDDLRQATHIWLPISLDPAQKSLRVDWRDQWDLGVFKDGLRVETDRPGTLRFWGGAAADLFTREIAESYAGVLRKNYVSLPGGEYPPGFIHASPIPQGWSGTCWTRDGATFLRELTLWGNFEHAKLTAHYLMTFVDQNAEGFFTYPEYFKNSERGSGTELDGTSAIIIGMVLLWERLPAADPFRLQLYAFLHDATSPIRYIQHQLGMAPLIPGTGEFGGGCYIPGLYCNIVGNNLGFFALLAGASMEEQAGNRPMAVQLRQEAQRLRDNIERHLVAADGSWIWCVDPTTLKPVPEVLNNIINRGFGGLNGPACMSADVLGLEPLKADWPGAAHCLKTFDTLLAVPRRKEQFEKYGMWTMFDEFRAGFMSGPSYGDGYAAQTMLLFDKLDLAEKNIGWIATSTFQPIPEYTINRESPYYFYERSYTPDAVGGTPIEEGCGALNLVNVSEPLKIARLILGVDDTSPELVKIIPRLPPSWQGVEAVNWPIRSSTGMVRANLMFERVDQGFRFSIQVQSGQSIPRLSVRLPVGAKFQWVEKKNVQYADMATPPCHGS